MVLIYRCFIAYVYILIEILFIYIFTIGYKNIMPQAIGVFTWDNKIGSVLDLKYPESAKISNSLTQKIYMSHAFNEEFNKEELLEVNFNNQTILSFCDKKRVPEFGYEVIILLFDEVEKENLYKLKVDLLEFGKALFEKPKEERKEYFSNNIDKFFQKSTAKKILLLGRAGTGKTSIKQIIFEGKDPKTLLYNPLEPTRGITPSVYSWLDLKLGLFDTSGQELKDLLCEENLDQTLVFENSDVILYLFDYPLWNSKRELIFNDLEKINSIIQKEKNHIQIVLFLHKIDLIEESNMDKELEHIINSIRKKFDFSIYFTSIFPMLIYNLYNAFYNIVSSYSEDTLNIKKILDEMTNENSKTMCYITNKIDSIIVQSMSKDFNTLLINHIHKMIAQLTQSFENIAVNDNIDHLIISSSKSINTILYYLNLQKFNIKNLIIISETLSANKLILLVGKLRLKINRHYYLGKKQNSL